MGKCKPPTDMTSDEIPEYSPGDICNFSAFGSSEAEILFPPNTLFKVLAVWEPGDDHPELQNPLVKCKTMGFDSDEGITSWAGTGADAELATKHQEQMIDDHDVKIDEMESKLKLAQNKNEDLNVQVTQDAEQIRELERNQTELEGEMQEHDEAL